MPDVVELPALSVMQPWAWLITRFEGLPTIPPKRVENRPTLKNIRGLHLVHAPAKADTAGRDRLLRILHDVEARRILGIAPLDYLAMERLLDDFENQPVRFPRGGIVGEMEIFGCHARGESVADRLWPTAADLWRDTNQHGLRLRNVRALPFHPYPGRQGVFRVRYPANLYGVVR